MLGLFGKQPGSLLGIDINATSITLLALSRQGRGYQVEAYAREERDAGREPSAVEPQALAEALSRVWRRSGSRLRTAAVAVAAEALISKLIELPAGLPADELEQQVEFEAAQYVPFSLGEAAIDFAVLGPVPGNPQQVQVLLVACSSEEVESLENLLTLAGLVPGVVDSEVLALERCLALLATQLPQPACALALLDIGANSSRLWVMHGQRFIYGRDLPFAGRQLAQAQEGDCSLLPTPALPVLQEPLVPGAVDPPQSPFEELLQQLHQALRLFAESPQSQPVELLLLAGAVGHLQGLVPRLAARLGIAMAIANPFAGMSMGAKVDAQALAREAPSLLRTCGLALRGFD